MGNAPTESGRAWSRRSFIKAFALGVAAGTVGVGFWLRHDVLDRLRGGGAAAGNAGALSSEDLAEVTALAEVLHWPEDDRERRELEVTVRWWATGRTTRGPHLPVYREGLRALRQAAGRAGHDRRFHHLDLADRETIVAAMFSPHATGPFQALAVELLEGIYASAPGWRVVGYRTWPGVASPPLEYTRAPAEPAGPVGKAVRRAGTPGRIRGSAARASA